MNDENCQKKIAVLIDADNTQCSKLRAILDELSTYGHLLVKRAYGDWSSDYLKNWKGQLNELAIQPIQQFAYTTGKNATDASMIIDAMDLLYTRKFNTFAIISSDSDFTKLASRLKESEIFVLGVGEKKTPPSFRAACDNFILTENFEAEQSTATFNLPSPSFESEISDLIPLLMKAWESFQDEDGWVNVAPVGNYIKRAKTDFDPRSYGATKLPDIIEKLSDTFEMKKYRGKGTVYIRAYRPTSEVLIARQLNSRS